MMMATQKKEPVAVTAVFWDIKKCPVPPGFDARRVGPCIKRFVEKLGYSGPLTIFAIGRLTDVPVEVLRALSSTGIVPNIAPFGSNDLMSLVFLWACVNPPPANIMIISDPRNTYFCQDFDVLQNSMGYNILKPYPYGLPKGNYYTSAKFLWISFLAESGALEEDKCIETGESANWVCSVCRGYPSGQGFENFTRHLYSKEHALRKLAWLPSKSEYEEAEEEEEEELFLKAVEAGVKPQPETWEGFPHMFATPSECPLAGVEAPLDSHPKNATTMGRKQPKRKCKKLRTA